jgi:hypothetical protein
MVKDFSGFTKSTHVHNAGVPTRALQAARDLMPGKRVTITGPRGQALAYPAVEGGRADPVFRMVDPTEGACTERDLAGPAGLLAQFAPHFADAVRLAAGLEAGRPQPGLPFEFRQMMWEERQRTAGGQHYAPSSVHRVFLVPEGPRHAEGKVLIQNVMGEDGLRGDRAALTRDDLRAARAAGASGRQTFLGVEPGPEGRVAWFAAPLEEALRNPDFHWRVESWVGDC